MKKSVKDFHNKKNLFIYSKDLTKGYYLKIDPNSKGDVAKMLHRFKSREPKVYNEDEDAGILSD
jgi:hypothetical protein